MKKHIDEADRSDLFCFAQRLGLDIPPNANTNVLKARIRASGHEGDEIEIPDPQEASDYPEPMARVPEGFRPLSPREMASFRKDPAFKKRVRVIIANVEGKNASSTVPLSVNGYAMSVMRGIEVAIPVAHLEVLEHAMVMEYIQADDGSIGDRHREVPMYPFTVLGPAA